MLKKWTPKELLYDLVSVQSDTFTEQEITISKHIYELIAEQDYWKAHSDLCGLYDGNDVIGRLIPWALRRGTTDRTIIMAGHTDCVEIDCYGSLKPFALTPDALKAEMLKMDFSGDVRKDLEDENWCFGRGTADMKGGDACILYELFRHAEENLCEEVNILYMGIPDEEHQAEGIMQSIGLLNELKEKYGLDYKLLLNPEPTIRTQPDKYVYTDGSIGKILPGIVVRGELAHVGNIMSGLNSTLVASGIAKRIELNTDLCCNEFGKTTLPPTLLYMKDSKNEYNVSVPNYTEIYTHIPLTKNRGLLEMMEILKGICAEAASEAVAQYDKAYKVLYGDKPGKPDFSFKILTFAELEEICRENCDGYEKKRAALMEEKTIAVNEKGELIQTSAGFDIIEWAIEMSKITGPVVVIGLLPPYVPAVNNHYMKDFDREGMIDKVAKTLEEQFGLGIEVDPYFLGLSDNSYTSCTEIEQDLEAMSNMVTPKTLYHIPFEEIGKVAMPSIIVGPWGKDYHTLVERVYLPDIEKTTPAVIAAIIEQI